MAKKTEPVPPPHLAFEKIRQRMRDHFAPLRPQFVAWLREFLHRPPPRNATLLCCRDIRWEGTVSWRFTWHSRVEYKRGGGSFPASPVEEPILTEDDRRALGLRAEAMIVVLCAGLYDLAADAWEEAGGYQFSRPVDIGAQVLRSPSDRQVWIDRVYSVLRDEAALSPETTPEPEPLPPGKRGLASAKVLDACRNGDMKGLTAWADALAAANDLDAAELLHWLPRFRQSIASAVEEEIGRRAFFMRADPDGAGWGFDDEERTLPEQPEASRLLARLLAGWDDYHPAAEWLFRNLALWQVTVGDSNGPLNLDIGEHFAAAVAVRKVSGNRDPQRLAGRRAAELFVRDSAFRSYGSQSGLEIPWILVEVADLPEAARSAIRFYKDWDEYNNWSSAVAYRLNTAMGAACLVMVFTDHGGVVEVYTETGQLWGAGAYLAGVVVWQDLQTVRQQLVNWNAPMSMFFRTIPLEWLPFERGCESVGGRFMIFPDVYATTPQWILEYAGLDEVTSGGKETCESIASAQARAGGNTRPRLIAS